MKFVRHFNALTVKVLNFTSEKCTYSSEQIVQKVVTFGCKNITNTYELFLAHKNKVHALLLFFYYLRHFLICGKNSLEKTRLVKYILWQMTKKQGKQKFETF